MSCKRDALHVNRRCELYFPEHVPENHNLELEVWRPQFSIDVHGRAPLNWEVEEDCTECPRSFLSRSQEGTRARILSEHLHYAHSVTEESGRSPLGDPANWPGWLVDAVMLFNATKKIIDLEFEKAKARYLAINHH